MNPLIPWLFVTVVISHNFRCYSHVFRPYLDYANTKADVIICVALMFLQYRYPEYHA